MSNLKVSVKYWQIEISYLKIVITIKSENYISLLIRIINPFHQCFCLWILKKLLKKIIIHYRFPKFSMIVIKDIFQWIPITTTLTNKFWNFLFNIFPSLNTCYQLGFKGFSIGIFQSLITLFIDSSIFSSNVWKLNRWNWFSAEISILSWHILKE